MPFFQMRVDGVPTPKLRHRDGRNGHKYTPLKTVNYEKLIRDMAGIYHNGPVTENPCSLTIYFFFLVPKSYSKKLARFLTEANWHHTKKPDLSNLEKSIEDALNGVVWVDDSQVSVKQTYKRYSETPGVEIIVEEFLPPDL